MESTQASGPTPDGPVIARSLAELEVVVRRDLAYTAYPTPPWIPARLHNGQSLLDVAIVGAGQGGLGTAFGLLRERITNIQVFDRNQQGLEGPWVTFARIITLRTPKHITGPDYGVASLTPRAWYEAKYGAAAWAGLDKIPARIGRLICAGSAGSPTFPCRTTPMSRRSPRRVTRFA